MQAPLAGIANWAFRRQSRRHGAGLAVSEMIASFGIRYANRKTMGMLTIAPDEHPVGVQVFGVRPRRDGRGRPRGGRGGRRRPRGRQHGMPGAEDLQDRRRRRAAGRARAGRRRGRGHGARRRHPGDREDAARAHAEHRRAGRDRPAARGGRRRGPLRAPARRGRGVRGPGRPPHHGRGGRGRRDPGHRQRRRLHARWRAARARGHAAARPWPSAGPPSATRGRSATSCAASRAPSRASARSSTSCQRFAGDVRRALGEGRACGYMRKFYPWYLAGHGVPQADLEDLLTIPTLDEALRRLRTLAAAPAAA